MSAMLGDLSLDVPHVGTAGLNARLKALLGEAFCESSKLILLKYYGAL